MASDSGRFKTFMQWGVGVIAVFAAIQIVPYGRDHVNPPVQAEPKWDSPRTREFFLRGCKNCHSNETEWPWYSNIAPASRLVWHDVTHARRNLNVSEWGRKRNKDDEAADELREGDMPPFYYVPLHHEARFTSGEKQEFIAGLVRAFGDRSAGDQAKDHAPGRE